METLLDLAFDNLSSFNETQVRKGLKQVEGLLAQICLCPSDSQSSKRGHKRSSPAPKNDADKDKPKERDPTKTLSELSGDAAFREFFRLQESIVWNIMHRLFATLDRLMVRGQEGQNDLLILKTLDLMQGVLLLHPPSKELFAREREMNTLLDLIEPENCPAIQCATIKTLVVALLDCPRNTRTFERLDGLLTLTSLFKLRETPKDVRLKLVEFLYFYLMPETPTIPSTSIPLNCEEGVINAAALLQRTPSKLAKAFVGRDVGQQQSSDSDGLTRSTREKQGLLSRHLSNVGDLVKDLQGKTLFSSSPVKQDERRRV